MKSNIQLLSLLISALLLVLFFFVPEQLKTTIINKIQLDSIGHLIGFFGLTWILVGILKLPLFNTVICLFFYSALTELSQYYLGFRRGEFMDVIADVVGISLFAVCQWLFGLYRKPQGIKS